MGTKKEPLRKLWESFVRTPQEYRMKRLVKLGRFLRNFLETTTTARQRRSSVDGKLSENTVPKFSDMQSVSNILAGEFLLDTEQICSSSLDDDYAEIEQYLLNGRGAAILKVLHTIGVQGLSSARELADVLINLLPFCCRFSPEAAAHETPEAQLSHIENCFEHLSSLPAAKLPPKYPTLSEVPPRSAHTHSQAQRQRHATASCRTPNWNHRGGSNVRAADKYSPTDSSESEETHSNWAQQQLGGATAALSVNSASVLGVYPGILYKHSSSNDEEEDADLATDDMNVQLGVLELIVLLLNLCKNLCYGESLRCNEGMAVSLALLPHLSSFLVSLETEYPKGEILEGCSRESVGYLKRHTVRTTITVASVASLQPNGIPSLGASGAIGSLLEVAKLNLANDEALGVSKELSASGPLILATDVLHGTLLLLHSIFGCIPLNPSFLQYSLKLLGQVVENQGLRLLQTSLGTWERHYTSHGESTPEGDTARAHILSLIESLSRLVTSMKKAKTNYMHSIKCLRTRHKTCDLGAYRHHHHDVLGIAASAMADSKMDVTDGSNRRDPLQPQQRVVKPIECSVSILADVLLRVFRDSTSKLLQVRVLCCLEEAGLCCCMEPARVMRFLLKPTATQTPVIRNYTLSALARALLEFCGGADSEQRRTANCAICRDHADGVTPWGSEGAIPGGSSGVDKSDSALSSSDASLQGDVPNVNPKWRCLKRYLSLINNSNDDVSTQVTQHILRLVSQGSEAFKQELFYSVFLPVMKLITEQYNRNQSGTLTDSAESGYMSEAAVQQHSPGRLGHQASSSSWTTESVSYGSSKTLEILGIAPSGKPFTDSESTQTPDGEPQPSAQDSTASGVKRHQTCGGVTTETGSGRMSETVVHYCLSALPLMLKSQSSQDLFLNCGGLRQLCHLVEVRAFRKCVLRVFQVLIMLEDRRAILDGSKRTSLGSLEQNNTDSADSEPGVLLLGSGLSHCHSNVIDAFMRLLLRNPEFQLLTHMHGKLIDADVLNVPGTRRADSSGSDSTTTSEPGPRPFEESVSTLTESLETHRASSLTNQKASTDETSQLDDMSLDKTQLAGVCDVWGACAALLPYSHSFQLSFVAVDGPHLAQELLMICITLILQSCKNSAGTLNRQGMESSVERSDTERSVDYRSDDACAEMKEWFLLLEASLVICLTCSKLQNVNQQELDEVLVRVEEVLRGCRSLRGAALQATCDSLLNSAATHRNDKDIVHNHNFAVMHLRIDDRDETEVAELSDYYSTARDTETSHTELGYEADSEVTDDSERSNFVSRAGGRSTAQLLLYPRLCRLVLELLLEHPTEPPTSGSLAHVLQRLVSSAAKCPETAAALCGQGLVTVLLTGLRKVLRWHGGADSVKEQRLILDLFVHVAQQGFTSQELKLYLSLFQEQNSPTTLLLETSLTLTEHFTFQPAHVLNFPMLRSLSAADLHGVGSSNAEAASLGAVSPETLSASVYPSHTASEISEHDFSAQDTMDLEDTATFSEPGSSSTVTVAPTSGPRVPPQASPLQCAPVQMYLRSGALWPGAASRGTAFYAGGAHRGFSVALWVRLDGFPDAEGGYLHRKGRKRVVNLKGSHTDNSTNRSEKLPGALHASLKTHFANKHWSDKCCHLLSLGNTQEQFQLWADPCTASLLVRLVGKPQEGEELLGDTCFPGLLSYGNWHHLGIKFIEKINGGSTTATVVVVCDGYHRKEGEITHRSRARVPDASAHARAHVVLGQSVAETKSSVPPFHMGAVHVFQDAVLTRHMCFYLYALGPDCASLSASDAAAELRPDHADHVTHDALLGSVVAQDVLSGGNVADLLRALREALVLTYNPEHPASYNRYHPATLRGALRSGEDARLAFLVQEPDARTPRLLTDIAPLHHSGLASAAAEIGGVSVYLFLLAKIIEQRGSERQQAKALRHVFVLKRQNPHLAADFSAVGGYALLTKLLSSERAAVGMDVLKVLLDACLTKPVLRWNSIQQEYQLNTEARPVIRDVRVVTDVLLAWRVWERAAPSVCTALFDALRHLVSHTHQTCAFNIRQLHSVGIVDKLLLIYHERLHEGRPSLSESVSLCVLEVIGRVVRAHPENHVLMVLCDFLLLVHPAATTYVQHRPKHFHFHHDWVSDRTPSRSSNQKLEVSTSQSRQNFRQTATEATLAKHTKNDPEHRHPFPVPNAVKRSQSLPVSGTAKVEHGPGVTEDRIEELHALLSDEDDRGPGEGGAARRRALTSPRTSPSSPEYRVSSARTSPSVPGTSSHILVPNTMTSQQNTSPIHSSETLQDSVDAPQTSRLGLDLTSTPGSSPETGEDVVDRSALRVEGVARGFARDLIMRSVDEMQQKRDESDGESLCGKCHARTRNSKRDKDRFSTQVCQCDKNSVCLSETKGSFSDKSEEIVTRSEFTDVSDRWDVTEQEKESDGAVRETKVEHALHVDAETGVRTKNEESVKNLTSDHSGSEVNKDNAESVNFQIVVHSESRDSDSSSSTPTSTSSGEVGLETRDSPVDQNYPRSQFYVSENRTSSEEDAVPKSNHFALNEDAVESGNSHVIQQDAQIQEPDAHVIGRDAASTTKQKSAVGTHTISHAHSPIDNATLGTQATNDNVISGTNATMDDDEEQGLTRMSAGLLELLSGVVVSLLPRAVESVLGIILKPDMLIVLARHPTAEVRTNAVKLLDVFLHRAPVDQVELFIRRQGAHLLAAQLHRHPAPPRLVEACFTLMCGKPQLLEDNVDTNVLQEMSRVQRLAVVPVLALLESATLDTATCHNTLTLLIQVFERVPVMVETMLELGVLETLCNVTRALNAHAPRYTDLRTDERHVLLTDVRHFYVLISEKTFSSSGVNNLQYLEDGLTLLFSLEQQQIQASGVNSEEVENVRSITCQVLRNILDLVMTQLETRTSAASSLIPFTRALSNKGSSQPARHTDLSPGELQDRFKKIITTAVEFVLYSAPQCEEDEQLSDSQELSKEGDSDEENTAKLSINEDFSRYLLKFLSKGILTGMERNLFQRNNLLWQSKDVLRMLFSRLFPFLLRPQAALHQTLFAVDTVSNEIKCRDLLRLTVQIDATGNKLAHYLYELLRTHRTRITNAQRDAVDELLTLIGGFGFRIVRLGTRLSNQDISNMEEDREVWEKDFEREREVYVRRKAGARQRIQTRLNNTAQKVGDAALAVTALMTHEQTQQRKKLMQHIKADMAHRVQVKKNWQQLIQQLTHERAVWFCPASYPCAWQLDPTEGPSRVRRRLQRCHLRMDRKFLSPNHADKLDAERFDPPLAFLFEGDAGSDDSAALILRLFTSEHIDFTCRCKSVTPSSEIQGELLIGQTSLYFVGDEAMMDVNYTQVLLGNKDQLSLTLPHEEIKELQRRWYQLRDNALEIFLTNGKTALLSFYDTKGRDEIYRKLYSLELPNLIRAGNLFAVQALWLDDKLTNFEYLTQLNKIAGRSFNDLMQYPVFPFILSSYATDTLDLNDKTVYRNLARPISVQYEGTEQKYIEKYEFFRAQKQKVEERRTAQARAHGARRMRSQQLLVGAGAEEETTPEPHHYGSHYSNSGIVLYFLIRLPPFTNMFTQYQDDNFDIPDRTFHSVNTSWRLASKESSTDVKEMIPEFFYLPEFLQNLEGFAFGRRQGGERVWDVILPAWCRGDARLFVLVHRQALESAHATGHLAAWIDLVFGFKQQGQPAVDAINVFHPATYFGVNVDSIEDKISRRATETMIKTYGQTPKQLFKLPHEVKPPTSPHKHKKGLAPQNSLKQLQPMREVRGLRWGNYVGSPGYTDPVLVWGDAHEPGSVASLVALPTPNAPVFALGPNKALLIMYKKEVDAVNIHNKSIKWVSMVSWGHVDGMIRIRNEKSGPVVNLLHWKSREQIRCCSSVDSRLLFFGGTSGVISVFTTKFNPSKAGNLQLFGDRQCLFGHDAAVTALVVCRPYSVLVSSAADASAIVWDLNRLCYVRSIREHGAAINALAVSDTLGDIATASRSGQGSEVMVHTINGARVGRVQCEEPVACLAYSTVPEGGAVNVLVGALGAKTIRFWSSWDLMQIRDVVWEESSAPIVSLTFTFDSQRLFVANSGGRLAMWDRYKFIKPKSKKNDVVSYF